MADLIEGDLLKFQYGLGILKARPTEKLKSLQYFTVQYCSKLIYRGQESGNQYQKMDRIVPVVCARFLVEHQTCKQL